MALLGNWIWRRRALSEDVKSSFSAPAGQVENADSDADGFEDESLGNRAELEAEQEGADPDLSAHPLYWTEAMCYPPSVLGRDMTWEEAETVAAFLGRLSLSVGERGALLSADALARLAEDLTPVAATAVLSEPWMVPVKAKASQAVVLARAVTEKALAEFGHGRLLDAGLSSYPQLRKREGLEAAVFAGDKTAIRALAEALGVVQIPLACTMATSLDYALACMGERGAMARVADRLEALAEIRDGGEPILKGAAADATILSADTWRRLSLATVKGRADGVDLLSREIAPLRIDLRRPWELRIQGLTLPAPSQQAAAAMAKEVRSFRRSLRAMLAPDVPAASSGPSEAMRAAPDAAPDAVPEAQGVQPTFATVLDGIVGGDSGGNAEATWGHLLEPLRIARGPDPDELYEALRREMPWMEEANRKAALAAAMAARHPDGCFRLPPLVLVGSQGIGKSRWARRLSELTSVPMHSASLAGASSSKSVIGSERGWASARPSLPAIAFSSTRVANPLLLVDEVDKSESSLNGDPVAALLPMLEKETAWRYPDIYLLGALDLSRVSFVFTANSLAGLSQPFLDRIDVVNVPKPSAKEFGSVASAMAAEAVATFLARTKDTGEAAEAAKKAALAVLESGGTLRKAAAVANAAVSRLVWSPRGLRAVPTAD